MGVVGVAPPPDTSPLPLLPWLVLTTSTTTTTKDKDKDKVGNPPPPPPPPPPQSSSSFYSSSSSSSSSSISHNTFSFTISPSPSGPSMHDVTPAGQPRRSTSSAGSSHSHSYSQRPPTPPRSIPNQPSTITINHAPTDIRSTTLLEKKRKKVPLTLLLAHLTLPSLSPYYSPSPPQVHFCWRHDRRGVRSTGLPTEQRRG